MGLKLSHENFVAYAKESKSPEDLVDLVWRDDQNVEGHDSAYLLIFELWRRLLPDKFALSIFCDELDRCIHLYDKGELKDEEMEEVITDLEDLLDRSVDKGGAAQEIFQMIECYCAHDLERFLYDYILEDIEKDDEISASELLDGFYIYIANTLWFDFLRARLVSSVDAHEGSLMLQRIIEQLEEDPDLDLFFEIATYLVTREDPSLFLHCAKSMLSLIKNEEQFQELIRLVGEYFCCLDQETHHKTAQDFLLKRKNRQPEAHIEASDVKSFHFLLEQSNRNEI